MLGVRLQRRGRGDAASVDPPEVPGKRPAALHRWNDDISAKEIFSSGRRPGPAQSRRSPLDRLVQPVGRGNRFQRSPNSTFWEKAKSFGRTINGMNQGAHGLVPFDRALHSDKLLKPQREMLYGPPYDHLPPLHAK